MTRDDLTALIVRVEAATVAEQSDVFAAALMAARKAGWFAAKQYSSALRMLAACAYESAAASLVPEGWFVMLGYQNGGQSAGASLTEFPAWQNRGRDAQGTAATPALALTAAGLRARLAQMGDDA
jgi:hypothetical protein